MNSNETSASKTPAPGFPPIETIITNPATSRRRSWKTRLVWLTAVFALGLGVSAIVLNRLVHSLPWGTQRITERVAWYFQHQQLQADARTLVAEMRYFLAPESAPTNDAAALVLQVPDGEVPNPRALSTMPADTTSTDGSQITVTNIALPSAPVADTAATNAFTPTSSRANARSGTPGQV